MGEGGTGSCAGTLTPSGSGEVGGGMKSMLLGMDG